MPLRRLRRSRCDLGAALGRVPGGGVTVARRSRAAAVALHDGWAVRSDLVLDAGPYAPVPLAPAPAWVEVGEPVAGSGRCGAAARRGCHDGRHDRGAREPRPRATAYCRLELTPTCGHPCAGAANATAGDRCCGAARRGRGHASRSASRACGSSRPTGDERSDDFVAPLIVRAIERDGGEAQLVRPRRERRSWRMLLAERSSMRWSRSAEPAWAGTMRS